MNVSAEWNLSLRYDKDDEQFGGNINSISEHNVWLNTHTVMSRLSHVDGLLPLHPW